MKKYLLTLFILHVFFVFAQQNGVPREDVKVGLVLSGGGAKGFAHIGVLKVLEEAGIRIDYISGTSMGAVVGGLYAAGYNAHELDSLLKENDFSLMIQDNLPRKALSLYQKENSGKYAVSLPIKKWKIGLPNAISKGQNVFNFFSMLTEHVHEVNDFSKLPIPFFCIATDLETGEEVVLDHGFLPEAIRASSSFPGMLAPVRIDDRILVDGGIINNYPIERLKAKGVDYIIGIDVQNELVKEEELDAMPQILMQIVAYQMYEGFDKKIAMTDVYLKPDMHKYNDFSFDKESEIVLLGEKIAKENLKKIKHIANQQQKPTNQHTISNLDIKQNFVIQEIEISGNENYTDKYCIHKLNIEKGEVLTHEEFIKGVDRLTATGNFKTISYKFLRVENGVKIVFELIEKETSSLVQFGVHYDNLYKSGVLVNFTEKRGILKNDFLSVDLIIGDNLRYNMDYFIESGNNWSFGLTSRYNTFKENISIETLPLSSGGLESEFKIPVNYKDFTTRLYVQTTFKNLMGLRLGFEHKYLNVFTEEIVEGNLKKTHIDDSNYFNLFGRLRFDSYDAKYFPKKGFYLDTNYIVYLLSPDNIIDDFDSFSQLYGRLGVAKTFVDKLTLHFISEAGITLGSSGNPVHDYHLGGNNENFINTFVPFYGFGVATLNESAYLRSALTFRYEIFKKNYISFTGNYARLNEDIWNSGNIFEDTKSGYGASYGMNTLIGPIEIMYTWTPDNKNKYWLFNLGFWF